MSFVGNEINDKEVIKTNENLSEEDIKILETLNLSNNDKKNKSNESLLKENENKIADSKENHSKIEEDDDKEKDKYIKKYKSNDSRLYGSFIIKYEYK